MGIFNRKPKEVEVKADCTHSLTNMVVKHYSDGSVKKICGDCGKMLKH